ncbi:MAG: GGDEF domain-containing protein [Proteobacteria bacterium]|nr:GGDEF domain-containing protein [Pseudomonadota bacterium]
MLNVLAILLVAAALVILLAALPPTRRLIAELPAGPMRSQWRFMAGLVLVFVAGYAGYLAVFWDRHQSIADLLVPAVFVCGACFVWLAARLSLATVVNVRRMSTLDRANVTDALSGLDSRHYLDRRMREEMMRAERHGLAVSVMLLDIDNFASVNATYGHAVGDQVLTEIGRILSGGVRESDVLVRYGGEEIAIVATHTPPAAAMAVAERLRREVEVGARKALREAQGARRAITVSIGVAGREAGGKADADLFETAERALRRAKSEGRNRVVLG